jgi:hypothetical protein
MECTFDGVQGVAGQSNDIEVQTELRVIRHSVDAEATMGKLSWSELCCGSLRRRAVIVCALQAFQQLTGTLYLVYLLVCMCVVAVVCFFSCLFICLRVCIYFSMSVCVYVYIFMYVCNYEHT